MRAAILVAVAAAALSLAACSQEDRTDLKEGAEAAGSEVKEAAKDIANDPDVKEAGAAVKEAGSEAAEAVKEGAAEVQEGLADASEEDKAQADADRAAAGDTRKK